MRAYIASRKGLLVTDPKVLELSKARLLMEYMVESRAENNERKFQADLLRQTLINTLGLDLKERFLATRDGREVDTNAYIPLVLLAGNHHLLKPHLADIKGEQEDQTGQSQVDDSQYDEQVNRMLADMEPVEGDPTAGMSAQDLINAMQAKQLGIKTIDEFPLPPDTVIIGDG